uniref:Uncharacterized protein n=1 Tax=Pipistrellus kuhlii TaxID=59472 RepID=A0A7J7ZJM5_PIPKU|nr:hypothetical protein mPipKuh1_009580 [Pipistrellus kuhlii]
MYLLPIIFSFLKKIYFIDFVQRGRERDGELETSMRESHRSAASCTPPPGDMPTTKVHALDRNRTRDPSVPKPTLYPLSQTSPGLSCSLRLTSGMAFKLIFLLLFHFILNPVFHTVSKPAFHNTKHILSLSKFKYACVFQFHFK